MISNIPIFPPQLPSAPALPAPPSPPLPPEPVEKRCDTAVPVEGLCFTGAETFKSLSRWRMAVLEVCEARAMAINEAFT
jgi:hypothetical protein